MPLTVYFYLSPMLFYDIVDQTESDTAAGSPLLFRILSTEKGIKNMGQVIGIDTPAMILKTDPEQAVCGGILDSNKDWRAIGSVVMADLAMGIDFELPGVAFSEQMLLVMSDNPMKKVDGVIGNSIFKHFVTKIDYDKMEITLTAPDRFKYFGKGEKIPLEIAMHPMTAGEVEMENGEMMPMSMTVDTGFHGAIGLNALPEDSKLLQGKCIKAFGIGVRGKFQINIGRINGFRIGSYHFPNVLSTFSENLRTQQKNGGVLGQEILKRFNVIFDYSHNSMILEPNARFNEPFEFENMAGFLTESTDEGVLEIIHTYPDSPAAKAGLKIGDMLEKIDDKSVKGLSRDEVSSLLVQEGMEVKLGINRDGVNISKRRTLQRLI